MINKDWGEGQFLDFMGDTAVMRGDIELMGGPLPTRENPAAGPKILAFGSHCLANFQPILDCFIPNFKLKYEDSENI